MEVLERQGTFIQLIVGEELVEKLLHQPLVQIRELANRDDGYLRLDTVRRLFDLDLDAQKGDDA